MSTVSVAFLCRPSKTVLLNVDFTHIFQEICCKTAAAAHQPENYTPQLPFIATEVGKIKK